MERKCKQEDLVDKSCANCGHKKEMWSPCPLEYPGLECGTDKDTWAYSKWIPREEKSILDEVHEEVQADLDAIAEAGVAEDFGAVHFQGVYEKIGLDVGKLVDEKQKAYGNSFGKAGDFLKLLYPDGIQPEQYGDALTLVRIFDKQMRIATMKDAFGESPYRDIAGYGLLGVRKDEQGGGD